MTPLTDESLQIAILIYTEDSGIMHRNGVLSALLELQQRRKADADQLKILKGNTPEEWAEIIEHDKGRS